jgi:transcriptional regulator with XRE-family HTH domain
MENELGKFLRELRGKMSLRDVAERCGLSHTYISDVEKGINRTTKAPLKASPDTLKRLAEAYQYSYGELMVKAGYWPENYNQVSAFSQEEMVDLDVILEKAENGTLIQNGEPVPRVQQQALAALIHSWKKQDKK